MKTLAILNQKGGSAKTTTAVNLAAALAEKKKRVLLIDLDPQCSASSWLGFRNTTKDLYNLFTENAGKSSLSGISSKTIITGLDIITASPWLVSIDKALASEIGAESILKRYLMNVTQWDYVLLDCSPTLGIMSLNALVAADNMVIPLETHIMAVQGLAQLLNTIGMVKERLNPRLEIDGILPCRVNKRTRLSQDIIKDLRDRFGDKVYETVIRENVKLAEAPSFSKPITLYDTKSSGAADYRSLAAEIIKRNKKG
jgi:chromosome partitioning protein